MSTKQDVDTARHYAIYNKNAPADFEAIPHRYSRSLYLLIEKYARKTEE